MAGHPSEVRRLYASGVDSDSQWRQECERLRLENQRLRDRVAVVEGMIESQTVGIMGSLQGMLDWMRGSRLPTTESGERPVLSD